MTGPCHRCDKIFGLLNAVGGSCVICRADVHYIVTSAIPPPDQPCLCGHRQWMAVDTVCDDICHKSAMLDGFLL